MNDMEDDYARRVVERLRKEKEESPDDDAAGGRGGLSCAVCGSRDFRVVDSRHDMKNNRIKRRRECRHCGRRVTTTERIVG